MCDIAEVPNFLSQISNIVSNFLFGLPRRAVTHDVRAEEARLNDNGMNAE